VEQTHFSQDAIKLHVAGQDNTVTVAVAGRLVTIRDMGKSQFAKILDQQGQIQIYVKKDVVGDETYAMFKKIDLGDIIGVKGTLFVTKTGEVTVRVESCTLVAKATYELLPCESALSDVPLPAGVFAGTSDALASADLLAFLRATAEAAIAEAIATEASSAIDLEDGITLFVESIHPAPRVVVVGAVDTAEALCRMAGTLGWRTAVVDPRSKFGTKDRMPSTDVLLTSWPDKAYPELELEAADHLVVLTHDQKIDDPAISLALNLGVGYVGALGSRRTQEKRNERLLASGNTEEQIARIHGPVGLDIGAHSPAETAVAILAEIIAYRSGRSGRHLKDTTGRIHPTDEPAS
jgi:xanthine dehydrogenase accessory factor